MLRSAIILLEDQRLALIRRERAGRIYYLLPGGGVEAGETLAEATVREAEEELGLRVALGRLVAEVLFQADRQYFFLAQRLSGDFGRGQGEEMLGQGAPEAGTYQAVWLPLDRLLAEPVFPQALCGLIVNAAPTGAWPATVLSLRDPG